MLFYDQNKTPHTILSFPSFIVVLPAGLTLGYGALRLGCSVARLTLLAVLPDLAAASAGVTHFYCQCLQMCFQERWPPGDLNLKITIQVSEITWGRYSKVKGSIKTFLVLLHFSWSPRKYQCFWFANHTKEPRYVLLHWYIVSMQY